MTPLSTTPSSMLAVGPLLATSTLELTLRMGVALLIIMGIMYLVTRFARRHLSHRGQHRPNIDVQYQRQLTKHATLSLVKAGNRNLLIASNNQAITLLAEGDDLTALADPEPQPQRLAGPVPMGDEPNIDIRSKPVVNPIKALQNRTVRRG